MREIRRYQKSIDFLISKLSLQRVIKEITLNIKNDIRFQNAAMQTIQKICEIYLINIFENKTM